MNIAISGINYAVTAAYEYIVRAFRKRQDCNIKVIGPYPGLWMPWSKNGTVGVVMPEKYDFKPDIVLPFNGGMQSAPINYIEGKLGDFKPDLWLDVDAGFHLDGVPKNGVRAVFYTDPHVLRNWYDPAKHFYKYVFNPQRPYATGDEYYLPYAADAEWHSPLDLPKIYDATLIGNTYQQRVELMNRLRAQGKRTFFELGLAKDDARVIYSQSIIGINWSSMQDLTARVFEISGFGIAPVLNRVPDLALFDEGVEYLGFDTIEQANAQIDNLLAHPEFAEYLGKNARNKIINEKHTWDDRVQTILEITGLTKNQNCGIIEAVPITGINI